MDSRSLRNVLPDILSYRHCVGSLSTGESLSFGWYSQKVAARHRNRVLVGRPSFLLFEPCNNRSPLKARTKTIGAHIMHPFAEHPRGHLIPDRLEGHFETGGNLGNGEILVRRRNSSTRRGWLVHGGQSTVSCLKHAFARPPRSIDPECGTVHRLIEAEARSTRH